MENKQSPRGTETILLAEDEPSVRELTSRVLRAQGYSVIEATDGEDALYQAEHHGLDAINLVLTDLVMPKIGGMQLAERLIAQRPGIRVLFMSGFSGNTTMHQGNLIQSTTFIQKPFSIALLAQKVREALDR